MNKIVKVGLNILEQQKTDDTRKLSVNSNSLSEKYCLRYINANIDNFFSGWTVFPSVNHNYVHHYHCYIQWKLPKYTE